MVHLAWSRPVMRSRVELPPSEADPPRLFVSVDGSLAARAGRKEVDPSSVHRIIIDSLNDKHDLSLGGRFDAAATSSARRRPFSFEERTDGIAASASAAFLGHRGPLMKNFSHPFALYPNR